MSHPRQLIRDAVVALLVAATTAAGSRVAASTFAPLTAGQLPAIGVYTEAEQVAPASYQTNPRELERQLDLVVEAVVTGSDSKAVQDAVDDIAMEVEQALEKDPVIGVPRVSNLSGEAVLIRTELLEGEQGDRPIGVARLTYQVTYRTDATILAIASALLEAGDTQDFLRAGTQTSLAGQQAELDQTADLVAIPQ